MRNKYVLTISATTILLLLVGMGFSVSFAMSELAQDIPPISSLNMLNTVNAPSTTHIAKLTANDGASNDTFGYSVAVDGDIAVVGVPAADVDGKSDRGAVYIFYRNQEGINNWGMIKKLTASDGETNDAFGYSVAISGDTILVGAPSAIVAYWNKGAVYVFQRNYGGNDAWGQVRKLIGAPNTIAAHFGNAVALDGDTAIVGAYTTYVNYIPLGCAYIFSRNQGGNNAWGQVKQLFASDGQSSDYFGVDVSVSGDTVVVGAYYVNGDYATQGAAYVYEKNWGGSNAWGEIKKLTMGGLQNYFGRSVAINGDTIVVGTDKSVGDVYVFNRNQGGSNEWGYISTLVPPARSGEDYFGKSVSISEGTIVVGASGTYFLGVSNRGAAYIYSQNQPNTWKLVRMLTASDTSGDDIFGSSVAIQGNTALIGANVTINGMSYQGAAYLYDTTADVTPPSNPTELTSTSHTTDTWSSQNLVFLTWSGATDSDTGVDGYSILWDQTATTIPDASKDIEEIYQETYQLLEDGSWYCHLRTVDNAGNWTSDAVHIGPFKIDTTAPAPKVHSPEFAVGSFPVIWEGIDSGSGIDYYDIWVREGDYTEWMPWILETHSTSASYTGTIGNTYYFASRIVDRVGNANDDNFLFTGLSHTTVAVNQITGQVLNNRDEPVFNASVVAQPAALNVGQSDRQGNYTLYFGEAGAYTLTVSRNGFGQLPPRYGIIANDNPSNVNFVLPPENDIVVNGGLEMGTLSGWGSGIGVTSTLATTAHTGRYSLQLNTSGSDTLVFWPSITQTLTIPTNWINPTLSWMYTINQGGVDSALLLIISSSFA